jgi:hypothetical protein
MPVHPHHAAERLKPERIAHSCEKSGSTVVQKNAFDDGGAEHRHAVREPGGDVPAVERRIGETGSLHVFIFSFVRWKRLFEKIPDQRDSEGRAFPHQSISGARGEPHRFAY